MSAFPKYELIVQPATGLFAKLLSAVKPVIVNADHEWRQVLLTDAPDFRALSFFNPDENRLSKAIAELLNPCGTHGQGAAFLKLFLQRFPNLKAGNLNQTRVRRECCTYTIARQQRRIDILVEGKDSAWGIGIENKPWAGEQDQQLSDYTTHLKNQYGESFVLLRVAGYDGDPTSMDAATCKILTREGKFCTWRYHLELSRWLKECSEHCKSPRVSSFIDELIRYIAVEFGNQPTDTRSFMAQKLLPILDQVVSHDADQIRAFAESVALFPKLREKWVAELFEGVQKRVLKELGDGWHVEREGIPFVETTYAKFKVWHESWENVYHIFLESQPNHHQVILGVWRDKKKWSLEPDAQVYTLLSDLGWGDEQGNKDWWNGYSPLPAPFTDWTSPKTISLFATRRNELEDIITNGIIEIGTHLKDPLAELSRKCKKKLKESGK